MSDGLRVPGTFAAVLLVMGAIVAGLLFAAAWILLPRRREARGLSRE